MNSEKNLNYKRNGKEKSEQDVEEKIMCFGLGTYIQYIYVLYFYCDVL